MTRHKKYMDKARATMQLNVIQDAQLFNILEALIDEMEAEILKLKAKIKQTAEQ